MNAGMSLLGLIVLLLGFGLAIYNYTFIAPEFDPYWKTIEYYEYTVYPFVGLGVMYAICALLP